jgi:hypothetical protein
MRWKQVGTDVIIIVNHRGRFDKVYSFGSDDETTLSQSIHRIKKFRELTGLPRASFKEGILVKRVRFGKLSFNWGKDKKKCLVYRLRYKILESR